MVSGAYNISLNGVKLQSKNVISFNIISSLILNDTIINMKLKFNRDDFAYILANIDEIDISVLKGENEALTLKGYLTTSNMITQSEYETTIELNYSITPHSFRQNRRIKGWNSTPFKIMKEILSEYGSDIATSDETVFDDDKMLYYDPAVTDEVFINYLASKGKVGNPYILAKQMDFTFSIDTLENIKNNKITFPNIGIKSFNAFRNNSFLNDVIDNNFTVTPYDLKDLLTLEPVENELKLEAINDLNDYQVRNNITNKMDETISKNYYNNPNDRILKNIFKYQENYVYDGLLPLPIGIGIEVEYYKVGTNELMTHEGIISLCEMTFENPNSFTTKIGITSM